MLFKGVLLEYIRMCREWLEMEENTMLLKKDVGFFLRQEEVLSEQDKLFNMRELIKKEMVPELFRECHTRMAELGKTIQFIKLYFSPEEKHQYSIFMNLEEEFAPIVAFIHSLAPSSSQSLVKSKPFQTATISGRADIQQHPRSKQQVAPYEDDPYGIFSKKNEFCHLRSDYSYSHPLTTSQAGKGRQAGEGGSRVQEGRSIGMELKSLLEEMLERVNRKSINLLGRDRIRDSIGRTMRGIKKFMLFEQGDFIQ